MCASDCATAAASGAVCAGNSATATEVSLAMYAFFKVDMSVNGCPTLAETLKDDTNLDIARIFAVRGNYALVASTYASSVICGGHVSQEQTHGAADGKPTASNP